MKNLTSRDNTFQAITKPYRGQLQLQLYRSSDRLTEHRRCLIPITISCASCDHNLRAPRRDPRGGGGETTRGEFFGGDSDDDSDASDDGDDDDGTSDGDSSSSDDGARGGGDTAEGDGGSLLLRVAASVS